MLYIYIYICKRKRCWMLWNITLKYITVGRCCSNSETYYVSVRVIIRVEGKIMYKMHSNL